MISPYRLALLTLLLAGCASRPRPVAIMDPGRIPTDFRDQLDRSAEAWNRGDLDGFMEDYARDSMTTYISGPTLVRGYEAIRQRYAPAFAPGARRDSLRFERFLVRPINDRFALVSARFILYRNGTTTASGPFTLLMERRTEGWKIVYDHSAGD